MHQAVGIVGLPACRLDNGADAEPGATPVGPDGNVELARLPADLLDLCPGVNRHPLVTLDLFDHLVYPGRFEVAIGWAPGEGLAGPGHHAAQRLLLLHKPHRVAGASRLQGRRHPGHTASHDQDALVGLFLVGFRSVRLLRPDHAHADVVLGEHLRVLVTRFVGPYHVLTQVHPFGEAITEAEGRAHGARRTCRDHHCVHAFPDVLSDELYSLAAAEPGVIAAELGSRLNRDLRESLYI
jgi:hypothetical protein